MSFHSTPSASNVCAVVELGAIAWPGLIERFGADAKELLPAVRRAVHRPGQINIVAIAAATILKAGLASRRQGRRLAPPKGRSSRS